LLTVAPAPDQPERLASVRVVSGLAGTSVTAVDVLDRLDGLRSVIGLDCVGSDTLTLLAGSLAYRAPLPDWPKRTRELLASLLGGVSIVADEASLYKS
jgi:hypothetical protein